MSGALNDHPVAPYLASKETRLRLKLPWRHGVFDGAYPELVLAAKRFTGASPKGHRRSLREIARELAAMGFINKRRAVLGIVRQVDGEGTVALNTRSPIETRLRRVRTHTAE